MASLCHKDNRSSALILPVIQCHTILNRIFLHSWEYSANVKCVFTHPNMNHKCYRERQKSTQCTDAHVSKMCKNRNSEVSAALVIRRYEMIRTDKYRKSTLSTNMQTSTHFNSDRPECQYSL